MAPPALPPRPGLVSPARSGQPWRVRTRGTRATAKRGDGRGTGKAVQGSWRRADVCPRRGFGDTAPAHGSATAEPLCRVQGGATGEQGGRRRAGFGVGRGGARSPEHRWRLGPSSQQQACRGTTSVRGLAEAHPQACVGLALQAAARLPQGATAQRAKRDTTCHTLAWKMFGLRVGVNTLLTRKLKRHEKELVFTLKTL